MIDKYRNKCIRLAGAVLMVSWAATVVAAPRYTLVGNVMPGANVTGTYLSNAGIGYGPFEPYGYYTTDFPSINEVGDLVGISSGRATVWKREGNTVNLGILGCGSTVSICSSRASAINNYGFVVGGSNVPSGFNVYFEQGHQWANGRAKSVYSGGQSNTLDINDRGDKVTTGIYAVDYVRHGFVNTYDGEWYMIGNAQTQKSTAVAVNNSGSVTGALHASQAGLGHRAYIWKNGAISKILNTLGGDHGAGYDINDNGDVVGESMDAAGNLRATAWLAGGNAMDLGTLGGSASVARSINWKRQIIGFSVNASGQKRAFLWENGIMYDLATLVQNSSGVTILDAYKITDRGHVLVRTSSGYAVLDSGSGWLVRPKINAVTPKVSVASLESMGSSGRDTVDAVDTDAQGNIYRIGVTGKLDMDYDPGPGVVNGATGVEGSWNGVSVYLQKLSPSGKLLWVKHIQRTLGGGALMIGKLIVDRANGSVYLIGGSDSGTRWDLDPGPGSAVFAPPSFTYSFVVAKYDLEGNYIRHEKMPAGSIFSSFLIRDAALDSQENVYISHSVRISSTSQKAYITKFSVYGGVVWKQEFSGVSHINSVAVGSNNALYITGDANGTVDFDLGPGVNTRNVTNGGFLASYTPNLLLNWVATVSNVALSSGQNINDNKIATDKLGSVYLAYKSSLGLARQLVKYNELTGVRQWGATVVADVMGDMKATNEGVYFPGVSHFGGNLGVNRWDVHYPGVFLTKIGTNGVYQWSTSLQSGQDPVGHIGYPLLAVDNVGNVSLHGNYNGQINSPAAGIPGTTSIGPDRYATDVFDAIYRRIP